MTEKLIIVGAGPAGYTAAIYAARAGLNPLLLAGPEPGGQLTGTTAVDNFPGFPDGIQGPDLMVAMRRQCERFQVRIEDKIVEKVDFAVSPLLITVGGQEYSSAAVILATGATALWLNVPGENEYKGKGVSACATCDGFFFKGKSVLVVGGGDSAMEEAAFLSKLGCQVKILVRGDQPTASQAMQEHARAAKVEFVFNVEVKEIVGDGKRLTGVKVIDQKTAALTEIISAGLFVAIGRKPNTGFLKGQVELTDRGYIILRSNPPTGHAQTSVPGVFAAGDAADPFYRQAVVAAGSGCIAALEAERFLAAR